VIKVSDKASQKIKSLGKDAIHVFVQRGGCAEYKYGFSFKDAEGLVLEDNGIKVIIGEEDMDKLKDIHIDHESSLMSEKFFISENPYVSEKCGCGISFRGGNNY
jgi:iron-sulfur cluster assembly protein